MKQIQVYFKKYLTTGLFTIGGIFLLLLFTTQLQLLLQNFERREEMERRVTESEADLRTIQAAIGSQAASQLATVDVALPNGKDATLIYSLLTTIAAKHAIDVESFSIDVGEVLITGEDDKGDFSSLSVSLDVVSPSHVNTQQFIAGLYKSLPISEIESLRMVDGQGQIVLNFFYFQPRGDTRAVQITSSQQELFTELSGWTQP